MGTVFRALSHRRDVVARGMQRRFQMSLHKLEAPADLKPEPTSDRGDTSVVASSASDWLEHYGDYLFNFAIGQVRDEHVAEDLVQETFLSALKARDSFRGQSSDRTWLIAILRNKICDHLRRVTRNRALYVRPDPERKDHEAWDEATLWLHEVAGDCAHPGRRMELSELRRALEIALGELPPRIAVVFKLYEIDERSTPEICEQLKISESNLWVMLHRARKQLREQLASWRNSK